MNIDDVLLSKVTYAFGILQNKYPCFQDMDWEEIEKVATQMLKKWDERKDIQDNNEDGYIIPYAIRKWEEYAEKLKENSK